MSKINLQDGEISLNERNSISGSSGLHNLTGSRARFQPVRIKALLSLFDSEDDDTEPKDSDDNSDTESLQALPDDDNDDEDYNNPRIFPKNEPEDPADKPPTRNSANETGIPMNRNFPIVCSLEANKLTELEQNDRQIPGEPSSRTVSDPRANALPSSTRKLAVTEPWPQVTPGGLDNPNRIRGSIFTPRAEMGPNGIRSVYIKDNKMPDMKSDKPEEDLIDLDNNRCKTVAETAAETPRMKSQHERPESVVETPALIFSHWSRNNFFQTPTHNPMVSSNRCGATDQRMKELREQRDRFCPGDNRAGRKPLSEATHLNQALNFGENLSINRPERRGLGKTGSTSKENCTTDDNVGTGGNCADKIAQSLQEIDLRHEPNRRNLSRFRINEEKSHRHGGLEFGTETAPPVTKEQNNYESITGKAAGIPCRILVGEDRVAVRRKSRSNSGGISNSKNDNDLGTEAGNERGKGDSLAPDSNGREISLPAPVNCPDNLPGVQFSVAAKMGDKKYGRTINVKGSDYLVLGKLGQGMSGEVLRVQEAKSGELRAIKCVDLSRIEKETAQGCLEEVSMLDRLRAPCVINMITYEIKSHVLYVVMEMGDTDLSKLLKSMSREKQLPLTMILYYWTEMLTAVKHIHDNGVIHSDLKPANFLLVRGRLKLIDFGIASAVNADMTSVVKSTSLGTLNYISPEAINDIGGNGDSPGDSNQYKINFKSDVWSLGCILYSLVYGQTPFQHIRANWAKVSAITNPNQKIAFPPPESTNRRGYTSPPPFLVDVMRRCLQHDRTARPTVSQLLQIPYVGCNCPPVSSLPCLPPSILSKIKHSLEESEWRQLLEVLERRKPLQ